ncbi:putative amidase [Camellia lanceoleosa]|uniref:Amidase n=1 Tax=Camellia lanceoleosa TaxID=1840588 RepID=A0ACC0HKS8_9ERIC|nr:putative amidase [Camellia lanceoleosa]
MMAIWLGSETVRSILCPSSYNSVVGIETTVGLTLTIYVLDIIVGFNHRDFEATALAANLIPRGGERGAILVDNLDIANMDVIMNLNASGEAIAILAEFKFSINTYLKELVTSLVRSLVDVIAFNQKFFNLEMLDKYGHEIFVLAEATNGIEKAEKKALLNLQRLSKHGFEKIMIENDLDGLVAPSNWEVAHILVIGWIFRNHCSGWISHKWYAIWDIFVQESRVRSLN